MDRHFRRASHLAMLLGSAALLTGCGIASPFSKNQAAPGHHAYNGGAYHGGQYQPHPQVRKYATLSDRIRGRKALPYQVPAPHPGPMAFQQWVEAEPGYHLYPGDQIDVVVPSAPELSRTLTVAPDGRINLPMTSSLMAAGKTLPRVQDMLQAELAKQLRDPSVAVTPRAFTPQQVFVGGQVGQPGTYTLPGPVGAIESVFMAGGWQAGAQAKEIAVLRRASNGGMMMRVVNLSGGLNNIREYNDNIQLRRGDIVFVPRTTLAEVGVFMQSVRNALPVDFNLSYQFGAQNGGTTVISP